MARELAPVIKESMELAQSENRELYFVATVCGTEADPQDYHQSAAVLKDSGAFVALSKAQAVRLALKLQGLDCTEADKEIEAYNGPKFPVRCV